MQAATGDTAITYTAQDYRNVIAALSPVEGIVLAGDLAVAQRGAGANMSVDVAAGQALIHGDSIAAEGSYIVRSDATYNVAVTAANATNPRIDIIVARVHNKQVDGGTTYAFTLEAIAGTPAGTPAVPATPGTCHKLAEVRVNANATSIVTSNITDRRQLCGVGDVPKWDMYGTTGSTIPSATLTKYVASGTYQAIGVLTSGTAITVQTPGRYVVHFCARFGGTASASNRQVSMQVTVNGTATRSIAQGSQTTSNQPLCASGTVYLDVGTVITPYLYQDSGSAVGVDDSSHETDWTGVWVGP